MSRKLSVKEKNTLLLLGQDIRIGAKTFKKIIHHYRKDLSDILSDSSKRMERFLDPNTIQAIIEARNGKLPKDVFKNYQIKTIFLGDEKYPKMLSEIYDPPVILYCRGDIDLLNTLSIAIVGSRKHTYYSRIVLEKIIPQLVQAGVTVLSGLALGVDGLAHYLTLENSGKTVGVLGCGVESIYPTSNKTLGERILGNEGLIISEFPPGTPPFKQNFPLRNRIIAGISVGTLVVEAKYDSGSLITAGLAAEFGREVFAAPGNIDNFASEGCNQLIKQGGKLVTSVEDIFSELRIKGISDDMIKIPQPENKEEEVIFKILQNGALPVDKIAKSTNLDIVALNSLLTMMEISGKVERVGQGNYRLKNLK